MQLLTLTLDKAKAGYSSDTITLNPTQISSVEPRFEPFPKSTIKMANGDIWFTSEDQDEVEELIYRALSDQLTD